jgi:hypothetical protein
VLSVTNVMQRVALTSFADCADTTPTVFCPVCRWSGLV